MDEELRKLERDFQQSGDPQSEARLLRKQLQLNMLSEWQLQVAAWMGYPPAIAIVGKPDMLACDDAQGNLDDFVVSLQRSPVGGNEILLDFAMMLGLGSKVLDRCEQRDAHSDLYDDNDTLRTQVLHVMRRGLSAAVKSFAYLDLDRSDRLSPDMYGFDGQIYHEITAPLQRSPIYFALFSIYNICEALTADAMNAFHERNSHSNLAYYNAFEFFAFEREIICQEVSEMIVPWILHPGELMATEFVARYFMSRGLR